MTTLAHRLNKIKSSPTIAVSTRAQELKAEGRDVINLASGEPDFNTPEHIGLAAKNAIDNGETRYTAVNGTPALKQAIVGKFNKDNSLNYSTNQIIVSTGAKQCLMNALLAILNVNDEVIIPIPYWTSYPDMVLLADAKPVTVMSKDNYKMTASQLAAAITPKTKIILLNSPSNPSGTIYDADDLKALSQIITEKAPNAWVICDDIYEHLRYEGRSFQSIVNVCPELYDRTLIINGVSKAYAMTGWRIGYAAGPQYLIKAMTKIQSQSTSNPTSIAQAAAVAALNTGTDCIAPMLQAFDRRRQFVTDALNAIDGISCRCIEGAFYAFANANDAIQKLANQGKISSVSDIAFCDYLLEEAEVATVPGSAFGCANYFRISFATSDDLLKKALQRIHAVLSD